MNLTGFPDTEPLITLRDWLRFGVSQMNQAQLHFGHGTGNAWDESVYLLLKTLHLPIDNLDPFLDACLTEPEREALQHVLHQRIHRRIPSAYLTHEAWLGDFSFYVDERVIIPRSYIAELLADKLALWVSEPDCVTSILDLCTGSGCLAILAADAFPNADIDAVDISAEALAVAELNVDEYQLNQQITLIESDLYRQVEQQYEIILSNPPYVNAASMDALPAEYRSEPVLALAGGDDGLDLVRQIIRQAERYLYPDGLLIVEIGHNRNVLEAAFPQLEFTWLETSDGNEFVFVLTKAQLSVL